jgi:hypothetical protein
MVDLVYFVVYWVKEIKQVLTQSCGRHLLAELQQQVLK